MSPNLHERKLFTLDGCHFNMTFYTEVEKSTLPYSQHFD